MPSSVQSNSLSVASISLRISFILSNVHSMTPRPHHIHHPSIPSTHPFYFLANVCWPDAQKYVLCQYNIPRAKLEAASQITPGKRAPTVTALETPDWVAVSCMVLTKQIAPVMDRLTGVGATDILVLNIVNSRTD